MKRLYVVVTSARAQSIRQKQAFPELGEYYALLEDGEIYKVPSPRFSDLSWHQVGDFDSDELPHGWEELSVEFPEDAISGYEYPAAGEGNRVWSIPPKVATYYLRAQSSPSAPPTPQAPKRDP